MDIHDADYNTGIPLVANGRYGLKISDSEKFLLKIVGTKNIFIESDLTDQFFGEFSTKTKSTILQFMITNKIGLKQISAHLDNISEHLKRLMLPFWENLGLELTKFYVTSIAVDQSNEIGRRVLDAISKQSAQSIGGYSWQQAQAFDVAKDAVEGIGKSNSGILGAVIATNMMGGFGGGGMMQGQYNQPTFTPNNVPNQIQNIEQNAQVLEVYCSNCSKKFPNTHSFCPHCGDPYNPCPKCGTDNDNKARRCVSCGIQLQCEANLCLNCNTSLSEGSSFCGNCGQSQGSNKCSRCGADLSNAVRFCPKCGQKR